MTAGCAFSEQPQPCGNCSLCRLRKAEAELASLTSRLAAADAALSAADRKAAFEAHRGCTGLEAQRDESGAKIHGYCGVCGVPWPCAVAMQAFRATGAPEPTP